MIRPSLARFINSSELGTILGAKAYVFTPEFVVGEYQKPVCAIDYVSQGQELWVIGDAARKENASVQVTFYLRSIEERRNFKHRFLRIIESAKATDSDGFLKPGIDFVATADLLRDSGDQKTYYGDQAGWFSTPAVKIFKNEDAGGEPILITTGFTIDYANGAVVFGTANAPADRIRATYKMGLIDFNVADIAEPQLVDMANNPHKYNVAVTLNAHFYIKRTAQRYT